VCDCVAVRASISQTSSDDAQWIFELCPGRRFRHYRLIEGKVKFETVLDLHNSSEDILRYNPDGDVHFVQVGAGGLQGLRACVCLCLYLWVRGSVGGTVPDCRSVHCMWGVIVCNSASADILDSR
jgi:hypothetical protein